MPELPEVETIRRHLAPHVDGRTLDEVEIHDPRWSRPLAPGELEAALLGRRVERLSRRGKYLVWELEDDVYLLMHLRMTGTLLLDPPEPSRHARVRFRLGEHALVFDDPRRFGTGELALGPEALAAFFDARLGAGPRPGPRGVGRVLRRAARRRAARARVHRRASPRARTPVTRADQGVPARPEEDRRRRQHLRRRGAVPRADPSAAPGESAHARPGRGAARRGRGVTDGGPGGQGRHDRRLPRPVRRQRELPGPVPRAPARGGAVSELRHAGAQAARGRARDLRVRDLPAAPACGEEAPGGGGVMARYAAAASPASLPARSNATSSW